MQSNTKSKYKEVKSRYLEISGKTPNAKRNVKSSVKKSFTYI